MRSVRRQLKRLLVKYQLIAAILDRLRASIRLLSPRTQRLLTSLERSTTGSGVYDVICRLTTTIISLKTHAGARSLCKDHSKTVDRVQTSLDERFPGRRVQARYNAAVLAVSVRELLRSSLHDVASLRRTLRYLTRA